MIALLQCIGGNDFDDLQFQFHVIKTQGQGKVIGILTMHLGKLPSHRFCSVSKRFVNKTRPIWARKVHELIVDMGQNNRRYRKVGFYLEKEGSI